jgi:hypothetical protein
MVWKREKARVGAISNQMGTPTACVGFRALLQRGYKGDSATQFRGGSFVRNGKVYWLMAVASAWG